MSALNTVAVLFDSGTRVLRVVSVAGLVVLAGSWLACGNGDDATGPASPYAVEVAFPNLRFLQPLDLQSSKDGSGRLFVVERGGIVAVFPGDPAASAVQVFLDLRSRVATGGAEEGLLGLAFHPDFANNGYYFVYYSTQIGGQRKTRLSRFQADPANADTTLSGSQLDVLTIDQPFSNHNGGGLAFGPDGYLYVGVGDGGGANDPHDNGQNRTTLLGSILRIDVDTEPYAVPADNPFFGNSQGYREEIFAYGFRNPWRFCFDAATGRLWVGDVGQDAREEIDIVDSGGNYGWRIMEGTICRPPTQDCDRTGLELPIHDYGHDGGGRSVTGGCVYRGADLAGLIGEYVYADFVTGEIWGLRYRTSTAGVNRLLVDTGLNVATFGVGEGGELFLCAFDGYIYRLRGVGE